MTAWEAKDRVAGRFALTLGVAALALVSALAPATVEAKKSSAAVTRTSSAPLAPGGLAATTAACPKKTHVTGGGFAVSPLYTANGSDAITDDSGTRVVDQNSNPSGKKTWAAGAGAFAVPPQPGTFSAIARCEKNDLGKVVATSSISVTATPGAVPDIHLSCPNKTHALAGGFSIDPPSNLAVQAQKRFEVLQSRRTAPREWTVTGVNPTGSAGTVTIVAYALCELDAKKKAVSEASAVAPIVDNGRTSATVGCGKKRHVVSGGFMVTPFAAGATVPAVGIDQTQPVGAKTWQTSLYEFPGFGLPPGSALTTFAYCKPDK